MNVSWTLEDAKSRLSELVRMSRAEATESVTVRGRRAVVVLDAETYERLAAPKPETSFVDFMRSLDLEGLDLDRPRDGGREVEF